MLGDEGRRSKAQGSISHPLQHFNSLRSCVCGDYLKGGPDLGIEVNN